jgi:caa(3)-type oxidase subunit IV
MADQHAQAGTTHVEAHAAHSHPPYVKIWAILVVLLIASVLGPMLGHPWLTLITAFGIAVVKALMVAAWFMHLNIEKTFVKYLLLLILALVLVFWAGVYPDVQKPQGQNWTHQRPAPVAGQTQGGGHQGAGAAPHTPPKTH